MNLLEDSSGRCRHREEIMHVVWGWGDNGRIRHGNIHTTYEKQTPCGNLLHASGNSENRALEQTRRGDGVGDGRETQEEGTHVYLWVIHVLMYGRNQHTIL